jgi:hypothetical protein
MESSTFDFSFAERGLFVEDSWFGLVVLVLLRLVWFGLVWFGLVSFGKLSSNPSRPPFPYSSAVCSLNFR